MCSNLDGKIYFPALNLLSVTFFLLGMGLVNAPSQLKHILKMFSVWWGHRSYIATAFKTCFRNINSHLDSLHLYLAGSTSWWKRISSCPWRYFSTFAFIYNLRNLYSPPLHISILFTGPSNHSTHLNTSNITLHLLHLKWLHSKELYNVKNPCLASIQHSGFIHTCYTSFPFWTSFFITLKVQVICHSSFTNQAHLCFLCTIYDNYYLHLLLNCTVTNSLLQNIFLLSTLCLVSYSFNNAFNTPISPLIQQHDLLSLLAQILYPHRISWKKKYTNYFTTINFG